MNRDRCKEDLRRHEGVRRKVYVDTEGVATIGVGRNLRDVGLSDEEVEILFANDFARALSGARRVADEFFDELSDRRQEALVNLTFNMGEGGLRTFQKMLAALRQGKYGEAAEELLDSRYATQVGPRAAEVADWIREG